MSIINNMPNLATGMNINGILKDYYVYAGENISAGDLVEYINGIEKKIDYGESIDTQLSTAYSYYSIVAVQISENKVFIAHSYNSSQYVLYGIVCEISGSQITFGTDTKIGGTTYTGRVVSVEKLDNGNVFIAHSYGSSYHLYGIVITIDGTTITKGTDILFDDYEDSGGGISTAKLENNRVFVAHNDDMSDLLYGRIVTIDGTSISLGTETGIVTSTSLNTYIGRVTSTVALSNGDVFIAHSYASSYYLNGVVCSITDSVILAGTDTNINQSNANTASYIDTILLDDGSVFIAHSHTKSSIYLYGIVCTVSGTTISKGTDTALNNTTTYTGAGISLAKLKNGNIFISHNYDGSNYYLYYSICSIFGKVITLLTQSPINTEITHTGFKTSSLLLLNTFDTNMIFIAHTYSSNYYLYGQIFTIDENNKLITDIILSKYETQIRKVTTEQFDGVAKSGGTGGDDTGHNDLVSIWTLSLDEPDNPEDEPSNPEEPEYVEVTKMSNIFPASGWSQYNTELKGVDSWATSDGWEIDTSEKWTSTTQNTYEVCDENPSTSYSITSGKSIIIKSPEAIKITKMKLQVNLSSGDMLICGSKDGGNWTELYSRSAVISSSTMFEVSLNNTDYYKYYKIVASNLPSTYELVIYEWQTSEYIIKELKGGVAV